MPMCTIGFINVWPWHVPYRCRICCTIGFGYINMVDFTNKQANLLFVAQITVMRIFVLGWTFAMIHLINTISSNYWLRVPQKFFYQSLLLIYLRGLRVAQVNWFVHDHQDLKSSKSNCHIQLWDKLIKYIWLSSTLIYCILIPLECILYMYDVKIQRDWHHGWSYVLPHLAVQLYV